MKKIELYKHNKIAYEKIQKHLETSNRTCVIHPTGSGKSFLSLKFLFDNRNKKCLFMCPTDAIVDQVKRHIEDEGLTLEDFPNLDFCLYASANKVSKNQYDAIVFDEFHRIGADEWGKNINELLDNNPDSKVLGVSATPIRYLDDNRDMSEEIFNKDIASEITLAEAMLKGILPTPTYISTLYSFEEDIKEIEEKIKKYKDKTKIKELEYLLEQAKRKLENSEGLEDVFSKNITNKNGKFIVFCRNIEHMNKMEEKCLQWFKKTNPNIEISDVHSKKGKALNQYYIDYFENNEKKTLKLLFSVEMLNEGLHVKNIDGVIMFRPTSSPIIYMQQLGRALSVGHNSHPLVFDIVNNSSSLESILNVKKEINDLIIKIIRDREDGIDFHTDYDDNDKLLNILERFKIIEEKKELVDLLNDIKENATYTWYDWFELAKAYYEHHNNLEIPVRFKTKNGYEEDENGVSLGRWIKTQRKAYKGIGHRKLTKEQIELLNQIGMRWASVDNMQEWMEKYNLAKSYYEYHNNLEIPARFKTKNGYEYDENGVSLGNWISNQRRAYKGMGTSKLTKEQIELLNQIGMRWANVDNMQEWMEKYNLAKAYYEHHNNLEIPVRFKTKNGYEEDENGVSLGRWISNQRRAYKGMGASKITKEQIELLEKIGIIWFREDIDNKLQKEEITGKNKIKKQTELKNRLYSLLNEYTEESLPDKTEINTDFMNKLNRKK